MKSFWLEKSECTGCGACANICPTSALKLEPDDIGFEYPCISEACIDCDQCERVCRDRLCLSSVDLDPPTYAARSVDDRVRFESTSGGAFTEIASVVLSDGGVVVAAAYEGVSRVVHAAITEKESLSKLRQSKYVQSSIGSSFLAVKKALKTGRQVLFCGAPCQVAGLKAYIGRFDSKLITVDFICRGVNSPKALDAWVSEMAQKRGSSVERIWFKYKEHGWKSSPRCTRLDYTDGSYQVVDQLDNLFMCGYLEQNLYMRPSCGQCDFKGDNRCSDITLGDFWGLDPELDDDRGTTLLLVNTEKGKKLLDAARVRLKLFERSFAEIETGNVCFRGSVKLNPKSASFFADLNQMSFSEALKKNSRQKSFLTRAKRRLVRMLKK